MTYQEANENVLNANDKGARRAFGCTYFHTICYKCEHRDSCYRKETSIRTCNFFKATNQRRQGG